MAAGILIGPYGLSIIRHVHGTKAIAEFGVVFLLFNIGLEVGVLTSKKLGFGFLHHFAVCCMFGCICIVFIRLCHLVYVLQLSVERLSSMKKYVFGLGSAQVIAKLHCLSI